MNWGNKLLLTFIVFAAGMFYLAYRSVNTNFELVEKDYYKNELRYQQVIDGINRANHLSSSVIFDQQGNNIILQLPEEMKNKAVSGNVWFYCAYDKAKDRKFQVNPDINGLQTFNKENIMPGNYTIKIDWVCEGNSYYSEKLLTVL